MLKNMKVGSYKKFIFYFLIFSVISFPVSSEDKIQTVPLINLEELSPTFEEDKDELEKVEDKNVILQENKDEPNELKSSKNKKNWNDILNKNMDMLKLLMMITVKHF